VLTIIVGAILYSIGVGIKAMLDARQKLPKDPNLIYNTRMSISTGAEPFFIAIGIIILAIVGAGIFRYKVGGFIGLAILTILTMVIITVIPYIIARIISKIFSPLGQGVEHFLKVSIYLIPMVTILMFLVQLFFTLVNLIIIAFVRCSPASPLWLMIPVTIIFIIGATDKYDRGIPDFEC
jgi:hypothetical protein